MLRLIGFLFVAFGVVIAGTDWIATGSSLASFRFREIGVVWAAFDRGSLQSLQPLVERTLPADAWQMAVQPALLLPAAPVAIVAGLVFFLLGLRGQQRNRYR